MTGFEDIETTITDKLKPVASFLLEKIKLNGKDNPAHSQRIEDVLSGQFKMKIKGVQVRSIVSYLRSQGHPIASTSKGYFYARSYSEIEDTVKHLKQRKAKLTKVIDCLEKSFPNPQLFSNEVHNNKVA